MEGRGEVMADRVGIATVLVVEEESKGGGRVLSAWWEWFLLEEDGLPARQKILDKSYLSICTGDK